jgi:glutathione peroxidase
MRSLNHSLLLTGIIAACIAPMSAEEKTAGPLGHTMKSITGENVDLAKYKGKVLLVVNVACQCGLTPQYEALQALYDKHKDRGLVVLGFPCNQFGSQEPGTEREIAAFCTDNYKVKFPLFAKIDVSGSAAAPLYKELTATETKPQGKGPIGWNFEKFVIGKSGQVAARFAPHVEPDAPEVAAVLEAELIKK